MSLSIGMGAIVHTPVNWTNYWFGGVWVGNLAVLIPKGISLIGSPVPIGGEIGFYADGSQFSPPEGLELHSVDQTTGADVFLARYENGNWSPGLPTLFPGEAILVKSPETVIWRWHFFYIYEPSDSGAPYFILTQPRDSVAYDGRPFQLRVEPQPSFNFTYQWQHDGHDILGATNATLTLPLVSPRAAGSYWVRVISNLDMETSDVANVVVKEPEGVLNIGLDANTGAVVLHSVVRSGWTPHLEYSTNFIEWITLDRLVPDADGNYFDINAKGWPRRYYRLRLE